MLRLRTLKATISIYFKRNHLEPPFQRTTTRPKYNFEMAPVDAVDAREQHETLRPPILWSSPHDFVTSLTARIVSIFTRRFFLSLLAGQVVSLCITITNVVTTELVMRGWALPTTQNVLLYVPSLNMSFIIPTEGMHRYTSLCLVFTPYTIYKCKNQAGIAVSFGSILILYRWMERMVRATIPRRVEMSALSILLNCLHTSDLI